MAKLMARASLGVWLTVALIVLETPSCESGLDFFNKKPDIEKVREIEIDIRDRGKTVSKDKLKLVGKYYAKQTEQSSNMELEEVKKLIENMHYLKEKNRSLSWTKLGLPESWEGVLSLRNGVPECTEQFIGGVAKYSSKLDENRQLHNFALERFRYYLEKCQHEKYFKKMVENIKQRDKPWDWKAYPTLNSYLEAQFWPRMAGKELVIQKTLINLLEAIKKLSALDNISEKTYCNGELRNSLAVWMNNLWECPELRELINDYFALYLDMCEYEQPFKELINSIEQITGEPRYSVLYPKLNIFLEKEFFTFYKSGSWFDYDMKKDLVSLLLVLEELTEEIDCLGYEFIEDLVAGKVNRLSNGKLFEIHFTLYLNKCGLEQNFKQAIYNIKQTSYGRWDSNECPTLESYLEAEFWSQETNPKKLPITEDKLDKLLELIKRLSALRTITEETDCTGKLEARLLELIIVSEEYPRLQELAKNYFELYLDKCGYENRFKQGKDSATCPTLYKCLEETSWFRAGVTSVLSVVNVLPSLQSVSKDSGCTEEVLTTLVKGLAYTKSHTQLHQNILKDYFALYLDKCGLEQNFKRAIDSIKQTSRGRENSHELSKFSSLTSYLEALFQKQGRWVKDVDAITSELKFTLSVLEGLSVLGSMSKEAKCTEQLMTRFLDWVNDEENYRKRPELVNDYLALYLEKCGFEDRFKKANLRVKCPTLYNCLEEINWNPIEFNMVLPAIRVSPILDSVSKESGCTEELQTILLNGLVYTKSGRHPELQKILKDYFKLYLDKCGFEKDFKKAKIATDTVSLAEYLIGTLPLDQRSIKINENYLAKALVSALNAVTKLAHYGEIDVSNCDEKTIEFLYGLKSNEGEKVGLDLRGHLEAMFNTYAKGCASIFYAIARKFKQENEELWSSIVKSAYRIRSVMPRAGYEKNAHLIAKCVESAGVQSDVFQTSCGVPLRYMGKNSFLLSYDLEIFESEEFEMFNYYLRLCSLLI